LRDTVFSEIGTNGHPVVTALKHINSDGSVRITINCPDDEYATWIEERLTKRISFSME
jgi:hypothetical protein